LVGAYDPSQAIDMIQDIEGSVFLLCVFETQEHGVLREWIQLEYFTDEFKKHIISNLKNFLKKISVWQATRGFTRHKIEQIDQVCKTFGIELRPKAFSSFEYAQTGNDVWVEGNADYIEARKTRIAVHKKRVDARYQSAFNSLKKDYINKKVKQYIRAASYKSGNSSVVSNDNRSGNPTEVSESECQEVSRQSRTKEPSVILPHSKKIGKTHIDLLGQKMDAEKKQNEIQVVLQPRLEKVSCDNKSIKSELLVSEDGFKKSDGKVSIAGSEGVIGLKAKPESESDKFCKFLKIDAYSKFTQMKKEFQNMDKDQFTKWEVLGGLTKAYDSILMAWNELE